MYHIILYILPHVNGWVTICIHFNTDVSLSPHANCKPKLFYSPLSFLSVSFSILYLCLSISFFLSSLLFFTHFPNFVCLVWECPCLMHLALTCARLLVKPRQPCSTGRCLKTCAAPRRTAKTPLRLLQSVLWRPPLRA